MIHRLFFILFPILLSFKVQASGNEPFKVKIQAKTAFIETYQKRAEYKMAKSIDFCRGFYIPVPANSWSCRPIGNQKSECQVQYRCRLGHKNLSRLTETRRIKGELNKLPRTRDRFKLIVGKRPVKNPRLAARLKMRAQKKRRIQNKVTARKQLVQNARKVKQEVQEFDEFAALEKELNIENSNTRGNSLAVFEEEQKKQAAEDKKQMQVDSKPKFVLEQSNSTDGKSKLFKVKPIEEKKKRSDSKHKLLAFTASLAKVEDQNANSVASMDAAWTPRWRISDNWKFVGRLGGHAIKAFVADESETFFVYDLSGSLEWSITDNIYVEGGLGIQKWNSSTGGSFGTNELGIGYQFDLYKLAVVDRVFFKYKAVGNDDKNVETFFGLGISF